VVNALAALVPGLLPGVAITLTAELPKAWLGRFAHLLKPEAAR
jgi:hypothetical protein